MRHGLLALLLLLPGTAQSELYLHAGYGQATYDFFDQDGPILTRPLLDMEAGLLRPIGLGGDLRLGSSVSAMPSVEDAFGSESYAMLTLDMLKLEYAGLRHLRARAGLGLVRLSAPVNELAIGLSATVGWAYRGWMLAVNGRTSRFEVDYVPNGVPDDTKFKLYYLGLVVGRGW